MQNKITLDAIGKAFFDYVTLNKENDINPFFFDVIKRGMADGVTLNTFNAETFWNTLKKNSKTISYVKNINDKTNFFSEDSVHNIVGYASFSDLNITSCVNVHPRKLGRVVMKLIAEDNVNLIDFVNTYYPCVCDNLIAMTRDIIGAEGDNIPTEWIREIWGMNTSSYEFLKALKDFVEWDTCGAFIEDILCENVINEACRIVHGDTELSLWEVEELHESVSCDTWSNIFKMRFGNENVIKEKRLELGILKEDTNGGISFNELKEKMKALDCGDWIDFHTTPDESWVFSCGVINLFGNEKYFFTANACDIDNAIICDNIEDICFDDIRGLIAENSEYDGQFYLTEDFKD